MSKSSNEITHSTLERFLECFNRHDLDAIMEFFAEDCELLMPRGPDAWGNRFTGKAEVRKGLASRFAGLPDVHYGNEEHFVAADRGVSKWLLTGTSLTGEKVKVRGCDLLSFKDGKITCKDSYWKIVEKK